MSLEATNLWSRLISALQTPHCDLHCFSGALEKLCESGFLPFNIRPLNYDIDAVQISKPQAAVVATSVQALARQQLNQRGCTNQMSPATSSEYNLEKFGFTFMQ